jgi:indolepyruvate ferredoxin oxidoreductase alpha subunit
VAVIQPYKVKKSIETLREAFNFKGVSVVISKEMCTLYAKGFKKTKTRAYYVSDKCRNHRDCISQLACPAFYLEAERVKIDPVMCAGCAVCAQICPENAILPVKA